MNSGVKSRNQGPIYKIHTWIYTGLSHGEGVFHYSLRAVEQLIDKSKLKSASLTMTVTTGREDGKEEDTVVIEGIWPPGDIQALAQKCEAVNDFLRLVFTELHQRWLIFRFTTTTADGSPLKIDKIDLDPKNKPTIKISDLIPQGLAGRPIADNKEILREAQLSPGERPFVSVQDQLLVPSSEISTHSVFSNVLPHVAAVCGRMLVLAEEWGGGWYGPHLKYERIGQLDLPQDLQKLVDARSQTVERPWWGKLAFDDFMKPSSERPGVLRVRSTSYRPYTVLWQSLDEVPDGMGLPLRERYWQRDLVLGYTGSVLPHILCAHTILLTADHQLLLTRRSKDVHFEARNWCPSIEEQVADGRGEATDAELQAYREEWQEDKPIDDSVGGTVLRSLKEELGIDQSAISSVRCYALATDWVYSEVAMIVVARSRFPSTDLEPFRGLDSSEFQTNPRTRIQFHWMPLTVDALLAAFNETAYEPKPGWRGKWHTSAKLRFFAALCSMVQEGETSWEEVAGQLASQSHVA